MSKLENNLIPLFESTINEESVQTVNARQLHGFLESRQDFSTWIKSRIDQYSFVENQDFIRLHRKMEANNATVIDYYIAIDMAKELSMVERNEKGKEARRYFIECEKRLKARTELVSDPTLAALVQSLIELDKLKHQQALLAADQHKMQVEQAQLVERQRITEGKIEDFANGAEHFSITAYNKLFRNKQISHSDANRDGRQLSKIARDNGFELGKAPHPVFGSVHTYPKAMCDAFYRGEYH